MKKWKFGGTPLQRKRFSNEFENEKLENDFSKTVMGKGNLRLKIVFPLAIVSMIGYGIIDLVGGYSLLSLISMLSYRAVVVIFTSCVFILILFLNQVTTTTRKIVDSLTTLTYSLAGNCLLFLCTVSSVTTVDGGANLPIGTMVATFLIVLSRLKRHQSQLVLIPFFLIECFMVFVCNILGLLRDGSPWNVGVSYAIVISVMLFVLYFESILLEDNSRNTFELKYHLKKRNEQLKEELSKSKLLVDNIFPIFLVNEMINNMNKRFLIQFNTLVVGEADLVNFTSFSNSVDSRKLCNVLNSIYEKFDSIIDNRNSEKLKTVGDAFIFYNVNSDMLNTIQSCLEMLKALKEVNVKFKSSIKIRIGLSRGQGVLGVIGGLKSVTIELFGNALIEAVDLEKKSIINKINVSEEIYNETRINVRYKIVNTGDVFNRNPVKILISVSSLQRRNRSTFEEDMKIQEKKIINKIKKRKKAKINYLTTFPKDNKALFFKDSYKSEFSSYLKKIFFLEFLYSFFICFALLIYFSFNQSYFIPIIITFSQSFFMLVVAILFLFVSKSYIFGFIFSLSSIISFYMLLGSLFFLNGEDIPKVIGCISIFIPISAILIPNIPYFLIAYLTLPVFVVGAVLLYISNGFNHSIGFLLNYFGSLTVSFLFVVGNSYFLNISTSLSFILKRKIQKEIEEIDKEKDIHRILLTSAIPKEFVNTFLSLGAVDLQKNTHTEVIMKTKMGLAKDELGAVFFINLELKESNLKLIEKINIVNDIFIQYDVLLERFNCVKIKSYIWRYLGISKEGGDTLALQNCLDYLISISDFHKNSVNIGTFRIGVSFGSFSTAIIGHSKWLHDVFGSVVNHASRLSETAETNHIHCTERVAKMMKNNYSFKKSKPVVMKGIKDSTTFLLVSKKKEENLPNLGTLKMVKHPLQVRKYDVNSEELMETIINH